MNVNHFYRGKDSQGEDVIKPYTPTTLDSDVGYFELVIKVYILKFLAGWLNFACYCPQANVQKSNIDFPLISCM